MRKILIFLFLFMAIAIISQAKFCINCGKDLPERAKFCAECGTKQAAIAENKPITKPTAKLPLKKEAKQIVSNKKIFRAKTDIYLYERRGDEKDALKKNLFFKPRRYRMKRNSQFRVLEEVGSSYLVQSLPNKEGHTLQGWVFSDQLALRSDWTPPQEKKKK